MRLIWNQRNRIVPIELNSYAFAIELHSLTASSNIFVQPLPLPSDLPGRSEKKANDGQIVVCGRKLYAFLAIKLESIEKYEQYESN